MALPVPRDLPVLPGPRVRAMVVLWNPDADLGHVVSVVEGDPALTTAALRAANSALSAPIEPVVGAREAIVRLGLATAREIISGALLRSEFGRLDGAALDVDDLWRHLIAVGLLAESLAHDTELREQAFVAGLLHDIGRLAMASHNPARYRRVVELVRYGITANDAERRSFGFTHGSWGGRLCAEWHLPQALADAAAHHHDPARGGMAAVMHRARELAAGLGYGDGLPGPTPPTIEDGTPDADVVAALGGREALAARIRWYREAFAPR